MMQQYLTIKGAHPDYLLFFRMGDFYELFFDDAVKASEVLDIALTKRGKHQGADIPMCGVPVVSYDTYLERLIKAGVKVAICEQVEDPQEAKKRGSKAVVKREVVRIATPGTLVEDTLLDARASNYLCALTCEGTDAALAWTDISTGECCVSTLPVARLNMELSRIAPREIILPEALLNQQNWREALEEYKQCLTPQPNHVFDFRKAEHMVKRFYKLLVLDALGGLSRLELAACGALLGYIEITQKEAVPLLQRPVRQATQGMLVMDGATRRNLELHVSLAGDKKGCLLAVMDRTVTGSGGRKLAGLLASPLAEPEAINRRLDTVAYFLEQPDLRAKLRDVLRQCPDMERALSRLCMQRGGPRDLGMIRAGLLSANQILETLERAYDERAPALLEKLLPMLRGHGELCGKLLQALGAELPLLAREGGFVASGYRDVLDHFRTLRDEGKRLIAALEAKYRQEADIPSLKIKHNNVLGYFIEITATHKQKAPVEFVHRQTMAGAMRFTTLELQKLETDLFQASDRALQEELTIFAELCQNVTEQAEALRNAASALAWLDVFLSLAELASERRFTRPLVDDSTAFEITSGRHPVVEQALAKTGAPFLPNHCDLSEQSPIWLLTGPNMAGKSTFLRQNALIAVMAQVGSFVPAEKARIGVIDRLFSRVGASDDLARGRSTFMVEMVETATILTQSTPRSLVILDEVGRGTSTFDGVSIAWAVVEHLHDQIGCRALFATHYHELTALTARLPKLSCHTMRVKEYKGEIVFLHEVADGAADRSYGIHVAKLAGLPPAVTRRAEAILKRLEQENILGQSRRIVEDLPLFAAAPHRDDAATPSARPGLAVPSAQPAAPEGERVPVPFPPTVAALLEKLEATDPDALSPRDAHALVYALKALL